MANEEVEYLINQDITIAPAEDIPLDGSIPLDNFESFNKTQTKKYKRRKTTKKKVVKKINKKDEKEKLKDTPKEKKIKSKKVKKSKKKITKKNITKKEAIKIETKETPETIKEPEKAEVDVRIEKVELKPEEVKPEPPQTHTCPSCSTDNNLPNYEQNTGSIKYFGITILIIILIIAAIFSIRYCGSKEEIIQIQNPSGQSVNIIASSMYSYNGFDFSQGNDELWYTYIKIDPKTEYYVRLHHGPVELESIPIEGDIDESFKNVNKVYLSFNPEGEYLNYITLSTGEIGTNFVKAFRISLEGACTVNKTKSCEDRPIITCDTTDKPAIVFKESEETKVIMENNCITIQGEGEEIVKASERLLYYLYGVMQK
ncbi:MAG: hypothetical protein U9R08_04110 [Nanoarchaeota archaeon]|nr:hypothetical protein [Nanoarchaeota archaeon]